MAEVSPSATLRRVSFIVPAFDEERRLGASLDRLIAYCAEQPYESEIIIVDDGSADATKAIAFFIKSDCPNACRCVSPQA